MYKHPVNTKGEELNFLYAKEEEKVLISKENEGSPSSSLTPFSFSSAGLLLHRLLVANKELFNTNEEELNCLFSFSGCFIVTLSIGGTRGARQRQG